MPWVKPAPSAHMPKRTNGKRIGIESWVSRWGHHSNPTAIVAESTIANMGDQGKRYRRRVTTGFPYTMTSVPQA